MGSSLPSILTLVVALLIGVLPLHVCEPSCGQGGGIVIVGSHAHSGHDRCGCGHDHPGDERGEQDDEHGGAPGHDEERHCDHAPGISATTGVRVCLPSALDGHVVAVSAVLPVAPSAVRVARSTVDHGDAGPPRGVSGIVLLR